MQKFLKKRKWQARKPDFQSKQEAKLNLSSKCLRFRTARNDSVMFSYFLRILFDIQSIWFLTVHSLSFHLLQTDLKYQYLGSQSCLILRNIVNIILIQTHFFGKHEEDLRSTCESVKTLNTRNIEVLALNWTLKFSSVLQHCYSKVFISVVHC